MTETIRVTIKKYPLRIGFVHIPQECDIEIEATVNIKKEGCSGGKMEFWAIDGTYIICLGYTTFIGEKTGFAELDEAIKQNILEKIRVDKQIKEMTK